MKSIIEALKEYKEKPVKVEGGVCPSAIPYNPVKIC